MDWTLFKLCNQDGSAEAIVSSQGGTVNSFSVDKKAIFYERRMRDGGKLRGGCHFCAPWFGSSEMGDKHGYLRDILGSGDRIGGFDNPAVALGFIGPTTERYPWALNYGAIARLSGKTLSLELSVTRAMDCVCGDRAPILPGLHPYYSGNAEKAEVVIRGRSYWGFGPEAKLIPLDGAEWITIKTPDYEITVDLSYAFIYSKDAQVVFWTDNPAEYFCVEPIVGRLRGWRYLNKGEHFGISALFSVR